MYVTSVIIYRRGVALCATTMNYAGFTNPNMPLVTVSCVHKFTEQLQSNKCTHELKNS